MRWPRRPAAGLGGCPFAPRTTGNIAIEDLVYLLQGMGVADLPGLAALLEVNRWVAERLGGEALPSLVARAGPFPAAVLSSLRRGHWHDRSPEQPCSE